MRAIVIGATGLIGNYLVHQLLDDNSFTDVVVIHRRGSELVHPKLNWHTVDLSDNNEWSSLVKGDVLFNAMGTTIKKAGSEKAMINIDVTIPATIAKIAKENGVKCVVSVSAAGADEKSRIFYNKIKGQLEQQLFKLEFDNIAIVRPSLLLGDRNESRLGEKIMEPVMLALCKLPFFKKYRPIHGKDVAKAMIKYSLVKPSAKLILELDEIQDYKA